jgi:hypothetical protein
MDWRKLIPEWIWRKSPFPRLENVRLRRLCSSYGEQVDMSRRLAVIFGVLALGLALGGCTKCGPIWDDWVQAPKSCKSDHF